MKNIIDILNWRYATKVFDKTKRISENDFNTLLEVLKLTPSSYGLQPWKIVVVENPEIRELLKPHSWNQSQITDASHLVVLCIDTNVSEDYVEKYINKVAEVRGVEKSILSGYKNMMVNNVVNWKQPTQKEVWARNQVYIALWFLMFAAAQMWIDTCPIEWFDPAKYDEILWLNNINLSSVVVCPLWYRWEDNYAAAKKVRFDIDELVVRI